MKKILLMALLVTAVKATFSQSVSYTDLLSVYKNNDNEIHTLLCNIKNFEVVSELNNGCKLLCYTKKSGSDKEESITTGWGEYRHGIFLKEISYHTKDTSFVKYLQKQIGTELKLSSHTNIEGRDTYMYDSNEFIVMVTYFEHQTCDVSIANINLFNNK